MNAGGSRRVVYLAAVLLALLALSGFARSDVAGASRSSRTSASGQQGIGALRICSSCSQAGNLGRYDYVILNSWDAPLIPRLKAQNPNLKALVYKNLSFTVSNTCSHGKDDASLPTGVGYCAAGASHPDWFLTGTNGERVNSEYFPDSWLMDVGNPGYQQQWLSDVSTDLRANGWDGVFVDDTDASIAWHLHGRSLARYPTDAAWRQATRSMLARVGPAVMSAGFLFVPNLSAPWASDYDAQATWRDWLRFTSGAAQEYYTKWGTSSSSWFAGDDWTFRQQFQAITEQAGKIFLGITYAPKGDARSMLYARANFLLFHDPKNRGALIYEATDPEAQDPYSSQWTADVGRPLGSRFKVGAAWRRNFAGGVVLVNPSSASVTVKVSASRSVTLGPTSGAILRSLSPSSASAPQHVARHTASKAHRIAASVSVSAPEQRLFKGRVLWLPRHATRQPLIRR